MTKSNTSHTSMPSLSALPPLTYALITDSVAQRRVLVQIDESGLAYFDSKPTNGLHVPKLLMEAMTPEDVGDSTAWLLSLRTDEQSDFIALQRALMERSDTDFMTLMRALYWAAQEHNFSIDSALEVAQTETAIVLAAQADLETLAADLSAS